MLYQNYCPFLNCFGLRARLQSLVPAVKFERQRGLWWRGPEKISLPWSLYIFHSYFAWAKKNTIDWKIEKWRKLSTVPTESVETSWPHLEAVEFKCQWCFDNKVLIFFWFNHNNYNFLKCDWCINSHTCILLKLICKVVIGQCNRTVMIMMTGHHAIQLSL